MSTAPSTSSISQIGFARSICGDAEVATAFKAIQRDLFQGGVGHRHDSRIAQARPGDHRRDDRRPVDDHVARIESVDGVLGDWSSPGELPDASALDVARTVCRRAERLAVGLSEAGAISNPRILVYLNRLSDVLWLFGRLLEARAKVDSALREEKGVSGPRWSRAW